MRSLQRQRLCVGKGTIVLFDEVVESRGSMVKRHLFKAKGRGVLKCYQKKKYRCLYMDLL